MITITLKKIISGGQTGADLAAWDAAIALDFPYGGWVPKGRTNLDGPIPEFYSGIREADSTDRDQRTAWNVRDSDATIVFTHGPPLAGSKTTLDVASQLGKPCLHIDFATTSGEAAVQKILDFLQANPAIAILNIAGSPQNEDALIYEKTHRAIHHLLLQQLRQASHPIDDGPNP